MRPYRGLTKEDKWVYGWYSHVREHKYWGDGTDRLTAPEKHFIIRENSKYTSIRDVYDLSEAVEVIPKTVGQSTGLKDKNGTEIYEGDILLNDEDAECMPSDSFVVKYLLGHFVAGGILGAGDHIGEDCKVIGNIHSNPELIEVKDNG